MGKVIENKVRKRNALMESAYRLFTTEGFTHTTIQDISRLAGVAKGTFYLYFKDKYDIRDAVIRSSAGRLLREACESYEASVSFDPDDPSSGSGSLIRDPSGIFIYIIDYLIEAVASDTRLILFISKHLSWGLFAETRNHRHPHHERSRNAGDSEGLMDFASYIRSKLDEYNIRIRDLDLLLFTLLELVSSSCHDVILYSKPVSLEEYKPYLNNCIRMLVNSSIDE